MTPDQPDPTATQQMPGRPASPQPMDEGRFAPGTMLAHRYRVVSLLGRGGMGEVYRANDLMVGEMVALKFLPEAWARDEEFVSRFRNEVRVARMVSHPNVCRVHDLAEAEGRLFLSMQFVDGEDLASLLRRIGRLPEDKALDIARKLCAGLQAAHDRGVIHRDLKPANIMIDGRGEVVITDFGLAGVADSIQDVMSGTPAYMSPEQRAGKEVTCRSDLYSLGLVLYEVFTGKRRDETPSTGGGSMSSEVRRVLERCCHNEPSQRPNSAALVARALPGGDPLAAALAAGQTPSPETVAAAGERTGLRPKAAVALFAIPLIAGLYAGWVWDRLLPVSPLAPEELRLKARELVLQTEGTVAAHETWGVYDSTVVGKKGGLWIPQRFWYRVSPVPLGSLRTSSTTAVGPDDPPVNRRGMALALFDMRGKLIYYQAERDAKGAKGPGPDWDRWLALTGTESGRLERGEVSADRAVWTYRDGTGAAYEITGLAELGRVRKFEIRRVRENSDSTGSPWPWRIQTVLCVAALMLAVRNYRLGRSDYRGAAALALTVLGTTLLVLLLRSHDLLHWSSLVTPMEGFGSALPLAGMYGATYLAMEPFVRRRWPTVLVTWTRLLHGEWRNPTVGRDVLIGFAATGLTQILIASAMLWLSVDSFSTFESLQSTPFFVAGLVDSLRIAVMRAVTVTFMLFLVRLLVRRDWIAAWIVVVLFIAMLAGNTGAFNPVILAVFGLIGTVQVWIIVRFGFLAKVAAEVAVLTFVLIETLEAGRWYSAYSYLAIGWLALVAFAALRVATAGQRLLAEDAL